MAKTMTTDFGERMRSAREAAGHSLSDVTYELRALLPKTLWCSLETVRRLENGRTPETKADPVLVTALATIYDATVTDLSPAIAESLKTVRDLLIRTSPYTAGFPGLALSLA